MRWLMQKYILGATILHKNTLYDLLIYHRYPNVASLQNVSPGQAREIQLISFNLCGTETFIVKYLMMNFWHKAFPSIGI